MNTRRCAACEKRRHAACRCAACLRTPLRVIAASSAVGGLPRHLSMKPKIWQLTTSHRGWICLGKQINPPQHARPHSSVLFSVYRPGGHPHATRVRHRSRPWHIAVSCLPLELGSAMHARLVAPSLAIRLRARLSVSRSAARRMRASRGSDPSPPAQAPESPYLPRFEAELGEMRENGPDSPLRPVWQELLFKLFRPFRPGLSQRRFRKFQDVNMESRSPLTFVKVKTNEHCSNKKVKVNSDVYIGIIVANRHSNPMGPKAAPAKAKTAAPAKAVPTLVRFPTIRPIHGSCFHPLSS